jgi:inhibitor of cysteine peptidase
VTDPRRPPVAFFAALTAVCVAALAACGGSGGSKSSSLSTTVAPATTDLTLAPGTTAAATSSTAPASTSTSSTTRAPATTTTTAHATTTSTTAPSAPKAYSFNDANSGGHAALHPRDTVTISLAANATTGYAWTVTHPPTASVVKVVSNRYMPYACPSGSTGCGGAQVVDLQAVGAGTTSISMAYARSFDPPGTPPAKTFTLSFTVS